MATIIQAADRFTKNVKRLTDEEALEALGGPLPKEWTITVICNDTGELLLRDTDNISRITSYVWHWHDKEGSPLMFNKLIKDMVDKDNTLELLPQCRNVTIYVDYDPIEEWEV